VIINGYLLKIDDMNMENDEMKINLIAIYYHLYTMVLLDKDQQKDIVVVLVTNKMKELQMVVAKRK
jgi:hypothetical protein